MEIECFANTLVIASVLCWREPLPVNTRTASARHQGTAAGSRNV